MPTSLRSRLSDLAATFSARVLDAIRGASLEELVSDSPGRKTSGVRAVGGGASTPRAAATAPPTPRRRSGRLSRRSAGDIEQAIDRIVGLLKDNPSGLRAEQIRKKLGLQAKELPRPIKEGLETGRFAKSGQKRATTYFVRGAGRAAKVAPKAPARPARGSKRTSGRRTRRGAGRKKAA